MLYKLKVFTFAFGFIIVYSSGMNVRKNKLFTLLFIFMVYSQ